MIWKIILIKVKFCKTLIIFFGHQVFSVYAGKFTHKVVIGVLRNWATESIYLKVAIDSSHEILRAHLC